MLQRAASNAYSWWWASHIRTKQSKWLEQNLQDMGEKVQNMLTLIEEDGDSFAKRAEMYYKKRPELINFVEESYRAYRALAERYDHISTELQNANNTIASVFPEQVQFAIDEEDEDDSPKIQKKFPEVSKLNIPKVPKIPSGDIKGLLTLTSKKLQPQKSKRAITINTVAKSGLSKPEALEEIDKLQKGILTLQTEKEFVKSSYEGGLAKYWEIEKQITDMQEKICSFQDEFGAGKVIEDHEARTLMAAAALKSCQQTLNRLQEKQERSAKEAIAEYQRIKDARVKFESIKYEFLRNKIDQEKAYDKDESVEADKKLQSVDQEVDSVTEENQELGSLREKIKEHFEVVSNTSLTVTEMAEKIDELVSKVIGLESAVSSQTALIKRLRTETDELQAQIRSLEDDKVTLIGGTNNLSNKLREMEEKLRGIQDLNQNVENQNINLQTHFTEARCNLDHLSEKLHAVKPDEELEVTGSVQGEKGSLVEVKSQKELEDQKDTLNPGDGFKNSKDVKIEVKEDRKEDDLSTVKTQKGEKQEEEEEEVSQSRTTNDDPDNLSEKSQDPKPQGIVHKQDLSQTVDSLLKTEPQEQATEQEDEPNWQQLFLNGLEDREKILLAEYTTILRSFKEVKKKLGEVEKKNGDSLFETTVQIRKLKVANAMKDEEIQSLRQTLNVLRTSSDGNEDLKEYKDLDYQPTSSLLDDQKVEPTARTEELTATETPKLPPTENEEEEEEEEDIKVILVDQPQAVSAIEEMFRMNIDELLEENLDFWLRFSSSFHQIQKFQTGIQDLQAEISKLKEKEKKQQEGSTTTEPSLKSDARPLYKHLREIQTELTVWIEQSALLKDELQCRFSSLCNIQEEISRALKAGSEDEEIKFTSYQAARFQGEVLNMKQENNKVADELQAGLDHVTVLQLEVEKTLEKLNEKFGLSGSKNDHHFQMQHSTSRSRVPLRSFIFGVKQKKQKPSIFSCMNPTLQRKYHDLRAGLPM